MEQVVNINNRRYNLNPSSDITYTTQPKMLDKYLRINNPTFKSDNVTSTLVYNGEAKLRFSRNDVYEDQNKKILYNQRLNKKNDEQIDIATQQFMNKKQGTKTKEAYQQYLNHFEIDKSNPETKNSKQYNPLNERSKSVAIMKLYMNNDESVYAKQTKLFNIISGQAQQQLQLRKYPKLSSQYKNNYNALYPLN